VALGTKFDEEDIPGLINEALLSEADVQQHILYILMVNTSPQIVDKFISSYCRHNHPDDSLIEFLSLMSAIWPEAAEENREQAIKSIVHNALTYPKGNAAEAIDLLLKLDPGPVEREVSFYLQTNNPDQRSEALDVVDQLEMKQLLPEVEKLAASDKALSSRAKAVMDKFNVI
jgi:hypothetical protein